MADTQPQWWQNLQTLSNIGGSPAGPGLRGSGGGSRGDAFMNMSQVQQRAQDLEFGLGMGELDLENRMFEEQVRQRNEILEMYQGAFGEFGGGEGGGFGGGGASGSWDLPSEFAEREALFAEGGQFGEGAKMEIERGGQQTIAAGQLGYAKTGMSAGTNVGGLQARVFADTALSKAKVEGQRVEMLGGALLASGQAGLTTQQIRAQRESDMMRALTAFA